MGAEHEVHLRQEPGHWICVFRRPAACQTNVKRFGVGVGVRCGWFHTRGFFNQFPQQLSCHVDPLLDNPVYEHCFNSFAFVDAAHFVEPTFLSSRGASRVTFIVWRCFLFRSTCLFALRSALRASSLQTSVAPSSALSLRSFASSASSTFGSCAFASVAARHRPHFLAQRSRSPRRRARALPRCWQRYVHTFARSAAACVPGVGCGVKQVVGYGVGSGAGRGVGAGAGRAQGSCVARARKVAQELLSSAPKAVASSSQHRLAHLLARGLGRIAAPPCGRGILLCYGRRSRQPHAAPGSCALAAPLASNFSQAP